jgi:site-specific DNA-cytosine methylase
MNTLRQAMENAGIKVDKYYSSEIKPYAIKLTQHHFPDTIQLGDITKWREWDIDWQSIGFVGSGSPCQDLSIAGNRAGIQGESSSLFFTFIEILNHVRKLNPKVLFLQENVGSANVVDIGIMSRELGVYPVRINSNLVVAQNRDRYYWTNIRTKQYGMFGDIVTDIPQPKDRKIFLKDIIESGETDKNKSYAIMHRYGYSSSFSDDNSKKAQSYFQDRMDMGMFTAIFENGSYRKLSQTELERLQGFPDGYTSILSYNQAASVLGDGWTLPIIEHILSFMK